MTLVLQPSRWPCNRAQCNLVQPNLVQPNLVQLSWRQCNPPRLPHPEAPRFNRWREEPGLSQAQGISRSSSPAPFAKLHHRCCNPTTLRFTPLKSPLYYVAISDLIRGKTKTRRFPRRAGGSQNADRMAEACFMNWLEQEVLITGGTGSFGKKFVEIMLREYRPKRLVIFSRDELKQHDMRTGGLDHPSLRYFLGDVRDLPRLQRAFAGITIVVHAAALKQVPACEYNPFEAIQTNIMGGRNVIDAAIDRGVHRVLALSTDKAVNPVNLYGATKLCAEKVFVQANAYAGGQETRFSCARYGNVVGSRGSVIPVFLEQRKRGKITITDARMTRFWLTLDRGVRFVIQSIEQMHGGEIFVPKIPSMKLVDLAEAIAPGCAVDYVGIRPGEKLHEVLLSEDEARNAVELDDLYIIQPSHPWWKKGNWVHARQLPQGFRYTSDTNERWLTHEQLQELIDPAAVSRAAIPA
jgi:UDP-N-acetylglucosamine 4,6-dehydratase